ncbi:MAG TPA: hypothetical protein VFN85_07615 [Solirubrobacterales bacterium]|nr:hypothetical protein [Solirubrobacterales bacterium]
MAKLWKRYTGEIYGGLRYLAAWPPSSRVEVGDVGVFEDRSLERHLSLGELGVEATVRPGTDVRERGWASAKTKLLRPAAAAGVPLDGGLTANGELQVTFEAKHATLLRAERSREDGLDRLDRTRENLLRLHEEEKWDPDWVLVTHVIQTKRMVALISKDRDSGATLRLTGGAAGDANALVTARGELTVLDADAMAYEERGAVDATPLYRAVRVQRRPLRGNRVKRIGKRGRARSGPGEFEVAEVAF